MDGLSIHFSQMNTLNTQRLALLSVLGALCLGIQLLPRPMNVEFTSLIAFSTGMVFGSLYGSALGALVMFLNGFLSPYGFAGVVMPFQIAGMVLIGASGGLYAKMANGRMTAEGFVEAAVLGALLTFIYDVITNIGTAVFIAMSGVPFLDALITALVLGAIPAVLHTGWNTVLFLTVNVPLVNAMHRMLGWR